MASTAGMNSTLDISVCVPVYRAHAEPNVATVAESLQDGLDGLRGELVVALNGISTQHAGVPESATVVDLGVNRGVAPGWNAAAAASRGAILVFANDDLSLGRGSLARLRAALLEHPEAGIVSPAGARWDLRVPKHLELVDLAGLGAGDVRECDAVGGFLFALRREVFDAAGGFDEAYAPCSMEEIDLCTTITHRLGLKCYAVAGVEVEHEYGISAANPWKRIRHNGRSELLRSIHVRNVRHYRRKWQGALGGRS
ncbi:MAG TPA: glycosyltransferase [Solirubrobacteraceae bacterium]|nr:glycosyltransferase [Solirubrobacteraceae bacterium]